MSSPATETQAARNAAIVALAARDLASLWPQVDWDSPDAPSAVIRIYQAIVTRRGRQAAATAARFYDSQRAALELPTQFRAQTAPVLPAEVLGKVVESAFAGIDHTELDHHEHEVTTTSDLAVDERVPARLEQKIQKHVLQAGRDTIVANVAEDPAEPLGWARVPMSDNPCGFCIMLASRTFRTHRRDPGLYSSERAATEVVGRGRGATRGTQQLGERYHSHCSCEAIPVFTADDLPAGQADFRDMYEKAAANAGTWSDPKKVLASMRSIYGVK